MYEEKQAVLRGIPQVIGLEGRDDGPFMIMMHGGTWGPVIYGHAYRNYYPELYNNCGLVWWDQYGCGRNHDRHVDQNITVTDFAEMTVDLVREIHKMFPDRKIILNGNSFGSYLAVYAAAELQDMVSVVIMLGPVMDMRKAVENFERVGRPFYTEKEKAKADALKEASPLDYALLVADNLTEKYTNCARYKGKEAHDSLSLKWILRLFTSKDWHLADIIGTLKAASTPGRKFFPLWNSLFDIDISKIIKDIKVPILALQGSEELFVLPEEMERMADKMDNMTYVKYPYCGHIPTAEAFPQMLAEMAKFAAEIREIEGGKNEHKI